MDRLFVLSLVITRLCLGQECGSKIYLKPSIGYEAVSKVHNSPCSFEIERPPSYNTIQMKCRRINICGMTDDIPDGDCSSTFTINEEEPPIYSESHYQVRFTTPVVKVNYFISSTFSSRNLFRHPNSRGFWCLFTTCDCGKKMSVGRIKGGIDAIAHSQPWTVYLAIDGFACGGTIISNRCVLTAAHCITENAKNNPSLISIYAGAHNISQPLDGNVVIYKPDTVIVHSEYNPSNSIVNDIALICLKETSQTMNFNMFTSAICLPKSTADYSSEIATVSGWGTTSFQGATSDVLKQVQISIITNDKCREFKGYSGVTSSMLCSFEDGKDACQGDSGGPLSVTVGDQTFLYGIISSGINCGVNPGIYTRVTSYIDWIQNNSDDGVCIP